MSIDWHQRYRQQALWTATLRQYIFKKIGLGKTDRLLEVGCGTGAILETLPQPAHGLDLKFASVQKAKGLVPSRFPLTCAHAESIPYADQSFDVVFCHFLLLWLPNPQAAIAEMLRVTRPNGHIIAFAEPDYTRRVDAPTTLVPLGAWQRDALQAQGADVGMGAKLTELFCSAGIQIVEAGSLSTSTSETFDAEKWAMEWDVLEADLAGRIPKAEIQKIKAYDLQAWQKGERILYVPTHYLWGRKARG